MLSRVLTFSLERHWIDFMGWLMDVYFPRYDHNSVTGRLSHVVFTSLVLLAVIEIFDVLGAWRRETYQLEKDHAHLMLMRRSKN